MFKFFSKYKIIIGTILIGEVYAFLYFSHLFLSTIHFLGKQWMRMLAHGHPLYPIAVAIIYSATIGILFFNGKKIIRAYGGIWIGYTAINLSFFIVGIGELLHINISSQTTLTIIICVLPAIMSLCAISYLYFLKKKIKQKESRLKTLLVTVLTYGLLIASFILVIYTVFFNSPTDPTPFIRTCQNINYKALTFENLNVFQEVRYEFAGPNYKKHLITTSLTRQDIEDFRKYYLEEFLKEEAKNKIVTEIKNYNYITVYKNKSEPKADWECDITPDLGLTIKSSLRNN